MGNAGFFRFLENTSAMTILFCHQPAAPCNSHWNEAHAFSVHDLMQLIECFGRAGIHPTALFLSGYSMGAAWRWR